METFHRILTRRLCLEMFYILRVPRRWTHFEPLRMSTMFPIVHGKESSQDFDQGQGVKSQKLMLKNGLIFGGAAGTFTLTTMTTRALEKLNKVIDRELQGIGAQKIIMPCLASAQYWKMTGRWADMGAEMFKFEDRHQSLHCLAPTHEEAVTSLVAAYSPISYKQLPIKLYQIGRKFRDEMRPKNGLLRCREFEMKDLYTFHKDKEDAEAFYEVLCEAYQRIFKTLNLEYKKVSGDVGTMGGLKSHEYHILSPVGEDVLLFCKRCQNAYNKELFELDKFDADESECDHVFEETKGIEIAHAFVLGTKYSKQLNAIFTDENAQRNPLVMGCYGIGVTRLLASSIEVLSTVNNDIRWPQVIAPYQICLIPQSKGNNSDRSLQQAVDLHNRLIEKGQLISEIILDDRQEMSIGYRIKQADSKGFPFVVVLGKKSLETPPVYEVKDIYNNITEFLTEEELTGKLSNINIVPLL